MPVDLLREELVPGDALNPDTLVLKSLKDLLKNKGVALPKRKLPFKKPGEPGNEKPVISKPPQPLEQSASDSPDQPPAAPVSPLEEFRDSVSEQGALSYLSNPYSPPESLGYESLKGLPSVLGSGQSTPPTLPASPARATSDSAAGSARQSPAPASVVQPSPPGAEKTENPCGEKPSSLRSSMSPVGDALRQSPGSIDLGVITSPARASPHSAVTPDPEASARTPLQETFPDIENQGNLYTWRHKSPSPAPNNVSVLAMTSPPRPTRVNDMPSKKAQHSRNAAFFENMPPMQQSSPARIGIRDADASTASPVYITHAPDATRSVQVKRETPTDIAKNTNNSQSPFRPISSNMSDSSDVDIYSAPSEAARTVRISKKKEFIGQDAEFSYDVMPSKGEGDSAATVQCLDVSWETCSEEESPELPENCATEESKAHFMKATKVIQAAHEQEVQKQEYDTAPVKMEEDSCPVSPNEDLDKTPIVETDSQEVVNMDNALENVIEIKPETQGMTV